MDSNINEEYDLVFEKGLPYLYRYRSDNKNTLDELSKSYLFFPNRELLNDPFDCYPYLLEISKDPTILNNYARDAYFKMNNTKNTRAERRRFQKDPVYLNTAQMSERIEAEILGFISSYGIGSFTIQSSNQMMWALYGNNQKGICLQFNIDDDRNLFDTVGKVNYQEEFESITFPPLTTDAVTHLFYTKSIVWHMEQEYRILKKNFGPHNFNPLALRKIIFGFKSEERFIKKVVKICGDLYPDAELFISRPTKKMFGLEMARIN